MKQYSQSLKLACWCLPALFLFVDLGFAQPPQGRGAPDSTQIAATIDTLAKKLSLTKELKEKVGKIYYASFAEGRKAFEKNRGDWPAMREARMQIDEKRDAEIKALLNDEQKKLYDKFIQEQRQRRRGERPPRPNN